MITYPVIKKYSHRNYGGHIKSGSFASVKHIAGCQSWVSAFLKLLKDWPAAQHREIRLEIYSCIQDMRHLPILPYGRPISIIIRFVRYAIIITVSFLLGKFIHQ